jgi:hypothetical protein
VDTAEAGVAEPSEGFFMRTRLTSAASRLRRRAPSLGARAEQRSQPST